MAGRNRPSFLKKQKEEQRRAKATRKREERRARKLAPLQEVDVDLDVAPETAEETTLDEGVTGGEPLEP